MKIRIHGASVVGPSHVKNCTPCQDAFAYKIIPPCNAVIAVADGLGSAGKSDIGAQLAVDTAVESGARLFVENLFNDIDLPAIAKKSVAQARKALENKCSEIQCSLRDLACTLASVVIASDTMAVAHIGDGAVILRDEKGLSIASGPAESEYTNEVTPLTDNKWESFLRASPLFADVRDVIVISDGCQRAALKKTPQGIHPFEAFCLPLMEYFRKVDCHEKGIEDIMRILSSSKLCENCDDDKTLVVINIEQ